MSGERAQSAVPADHRSAHPNFVGVPWWGAVLLAVMATAIGFAFDAGRGDRELSTVFAVCYALGCVLAVLAVRQSGVFTAVIQPPLILFVTVPGAYFLFHGGQLGGLKDVAINCGYPLIERFPLMLFTTAVVLLIGLARWYVGLSTHGATDALPNENDGPKTARSFVGADLVAAITSKFSELVVRKPPSPRAAVTRSGDEAPRRRRRAADRPARRRPSPAATGTRGERGERSERGESVRSGSVRGEPARGERRPTKRTPPPPRHRPRPRRTIGEEFGEPMPERPRRPRPPRTAESAVPPGEPRRRVRTQPAEPRQQPPPAERRRAAAPGDRPQRRRRFDDYQPFEESYPRPPRATNGRNAAAESSTHHPVSRVRYRANEDDDMEPPRRRPRPRTPSSEYDG